VAAAAGTFFLGERRVTVEEIEKLFEDLRRGSPNDMALIVKKEALYRASVMLACYLSGWIVLAQKL
jgi:hypothetical protein